MGNKLNLKGKYPPADIFPPMKTTSKKQVLGTISEIIFLPCS